jgi:hypothetical protein
MRKPLLFSVLAVTALSPAVAQGRYHDDYGYDRPAIDRPSITVFKDDGFRGNNMVIDRPIRRLSEVGWDDKISSIGLDGGAWLVCVDDDFRGRCEVIDRSIGKLSRIGLDDKISSLRPLRQRDRWDDYQDGR